MFAYKRSLLDASQKNYIFLIYDFLIFFIFNIVKWVVLYITSDYVVFLVLTIISTIVTNIVISMIVDRHNDLYSEIVEISIEDKNKLKKNILGGFTNQLASVIVFSTDNLLISKFLGIVEVGLYGNYSLITTNINVIIRQLTSSHTATIGNLIATSDSNKVEDVFKKYTFMNYFLVCFSSLMVLKLISPFVSIWLGSKFLLDQSIVYLLAIYLFINSYRNAFFVFMGGYGLYWAQKPKAISEAILNIVLSLLFLSVFKLGMSGILLGTICSNVFVNMWYEPYIIYKYGLKKDVMNFVRLFIKQVLVYIVIFILISRINFTIGNIFQWIIFSIIYAIIIFVSISVFYFRSDEYKFTMNFVVGTFKKVLAKVK